MPRFVDKLSPAFVKNAEKGKVKPGMYADGGGLYLCVGAPTAKALAKDPKAAGAVSWIFRYMHNKRAHEMGLGSLHTFGLAEARERARRARQQRADDIDPLAERQAKRDRARLEAAKAMTFRQCAEHYVAANRAAWKNAKHAGQWETTLETYVYPTLGKLPVQVIDTGLVMQVLEPIWTSKPETASRVRGRIESILDYAAVREWRPKGDNPARWRGHLDKALPAPTDAKRAVRRETGRTEHHRALPYDEIAAFMAELRRRPGMAACALEFAILTAARTGEVIGARWGEIDSANRIWTVPAGRMKGGREHRVPLSDAAWRLIEQCCDRQAADSLLFPGADPRRPLSQMALLMMLRRMQRDDVTAHGFRSTFRDWAAERTNFPAEVAEMALGHAVGDKVESAYRRGDLFQKRRQLADAWAKFCTAKPPAAGDNVTPLRRKA